MKTIDIETAEKELIKRVVSCSIEDAVYEFAFDLVTKFIQEIEQEYWVEDEDGFPCMSDSDSAEMWYDDKREIAMDIIYNKMREFLER